MILAGGSSIVRFEYVQRKLVTDPQQVESRRMQSLGLGHNIKCGSNDFPGARRCLDHGIEGRGIWVRERLADEVDKNRDDRFVEAPASIGVLQGAVIAL